MAGDGGNAFAFLLHQLDDDVAVALGNLAPGIHRARSVRGGQCLDITLSEPLNAGHKVALRDLKRGHIVQKSGMPIGVVTADIPAGSHVHVHNLSSVQWNKSN